MDKPGAPPADRQEITEGAEPGHSEAVLRALLAHAPFGIHVVRADGTTVEANRAYRRIVGATPPKGFNIIRGDFLERIGIRREVERAFRGAVVHLPPKRYPTANELWNEGDSGARGPVLAVTALPVRDEAGALTHVVFVLIDITAEHEAGEQAERRRAEAEEARRWLEAVVQQLPGGVILAEIPSGRLLLANAELERILGHGMLPSTELDEYAHWGAIHPDGTPYRPEEHPLARAVAHLEEIQGEEVLYRRPDGAVRALIASAAPIRDPAGEAHTAVATFFDATDRKEAETLREAVAAAGRDLVLSLDLRETIEKVTRLAIPTFSDACVLHLLENNKRFVQASVAHSESEAEERLARTPSAYSAASLTGRLAFRCVRTGEPIHVSGREDPLLREPGLDATSLDRLRDLKLHSAYIVPLAARGGAIGTLSFVLTDTRRSFDDLRRAKLREYALIAAIAIENARLYEEARDAVESRDHVLAAVSHDLRNPLSVIDISSRLLLRSEPSDRAGWQEGVVKVQRAARRMRHLIDDLVDLASLDAGQLSIARRPELAVEILEEVVADQRVVAEAVGCRVERVPDPQGDRLVVSCDRGRIRQVLGNIADNAIRHCPKGEAVRLGVERAAGEAVFFVSDCGPGLPEADQRQVFERYWRKGKDSRSAGLGLSIARALVEAHGGRIWVESAIGQGSTFRFSIPLSDDLFG